MDRAEFKRLEKLLEPCLEPEDLDRYIQENFNITLPWDTVDERSTSAPLKFMWEVYKHLLTGQGPSRHVMAVSRNGMKTLSSSMLHYFAMLHFRRDCIQLAATLDQSAQAIRYVDTFISNPILAQYQISDNSKIKEFVGLPANDFTRRPNAILRVVTATKKGANSARASFLCADEVDLTPPEILAETAFIADPSIAIKPDGEVVKMNPVSIYLSSRKSNSGPIQELIDEAEAPARPGKKKPRLHKWSIVDLMEKCQEETHKPELGSYTAYVESDTLETKWSDEEFSYVPDANKTKYLEYKAYEGCKTCPAWTACLGRSTEQRGSSPMLRTIDFVGDVLDNVKDPAAIIAQGLNWKPETTGIVYKTFDRNRHVKKPIQFYKWVTFGKYYDPQNFGVTEIERRLATNDPVEIGPLIPTKEIIYDAMVEAGWTMGGGVDWGFTDPAVSVTAGYHKKFGMGAVLHVEHAFGHANIVWAEYVSKNIANRFPYEYVAPDQADPSSINYFRQFGVRSLGRGEKPKRIETGVSFVRGLLWNPQTNTSNFAMLDDSMWENGCDFAIEEFKLWTHAKDALGRYVLDKFDDDNNHFHDALRYFFHPFTKAHSIKQSSSQKRSREQTNRALVEAVRQGDQEALEVIKKKEEVKNQFSDFMRQEHGIQDVFGTPKTEPDRPKPKTSKRTSGIKFSI